MNKIVTILATILIGVLSCGVIYLIYLSKHPEFLM